MGGVCRGASQRLTLHIIAVPLQQGLETGMGAEAEGVEVRYYESETQNPSEMLRSYWWGRGGELPNPFSFL